MSEDMTHKAVAGACGVGREGIKCAVVSWVMPLIAVVVLALGMEFPVLRVFNILFVAFGITALIRSVEHIRRFGSCGLGGHVAVGVVLNLAILILITLYVFTALDPLSIRTP
jgi:hypothetical protein